MSFKKLIVAERGMIVVMLIAISFGVAFLRAGIVLIILNFDYLLHPENLSVNKYYLGLSLGFAAAVVSMAIALILLLLFILTSIDFINRAKITKF